MMKETNPEDEERTGAGASGGLFSGKKKTEIIGNNLQNKLIVSRKVSKQL